MRLNGATALKLDESFEIKDEPQNDIINDASTSLNNEEANNVSTENNFNDLPTGVSIESASYIENSSLENNEEITEQADSIIMRKNIRLNYFLKKIIRPKKLIMKITNNLTEIQMNYLIRI